MKSTGVVRKIDELGRIVISKELRKTLKIKVGTPMEIFTEGENIVLGKYNPGCNCCESIDVVTEILGIKLCEKCLDQFEKARKEVNKLR